jgi:hypothetical protein
MSELRKTEPQILQEFIDSLTHAEGASWQMIHQRSDTRWIPIRDMLSKIKDSAISMAVTKIIT